MSQNIEIRQKNPDESENMAKLTDADGDVYGYLSREVADSFGEYLTMTVSETGEGDADATLDGVTGKTGDGNYATFETPGGAVVGLGIALDLLESILDFEVERDEDGVVQNPPAGIGLAFAASDEESFEASDGPDEDEVNALLGGSDDESDGADAEDEAEEVEISDEELDLVAE